MTRNAKGFTLLEILVVISLMVVLMGLFVVQLSTSGSKELSEQATQFERQFKMAFSNAQQQQKTLVLMVRSQDYTFIELVIPKTPGETLSFKKFEPFKKQKPSDVFFVVDAKEGFDWSESVFAPVFKSVEEQLAGAELIFIMPSGQVTPEFTMEFRASDSVFALEYIGQGRFEEAGNE